MRFSSVVKRGDLWCTDRDKAFEEFSVLYDIRDKVQGEFKLGWDDYWHMTAQKRCSQLLQDIWKAEYMEAKAGAQSPSGYAALPLSARDTKSRFNVYLFQRWGGHQWVQIFWAFGIADRDCVKIYNAYYKADLLAKGHVYRDPDCVLVAGAPSPSTLIPAYKGLHLSNRKRHKDYEESRWKLYCPVDISMFEVGGGEGGLP